MLTMIMLAGLMIGIVKGQEASEAKMGEQKKE